MSLSWYNKEEMLLRNLFILVPKEEMDQQSSQYKVAYGSIVSQWILVIIHLFADFLMLYISCKKDKDSIKEHLVTRF